VPRPRKATLRIAKKAQPPAPVQDIRSELSKLMREQDDPERPGEKIGSAVGVYAFFDFDGEPIYVGQTSAMFSDRVGRHLTGQRSDAVGKFILDPFEVAEVAMWSVPAVALAMDEKDPTKKAGTAVKKRMLDPYEYTVYAQLKEQSHFKAVLNERPIKPAPIVELPEPVRGRIIPKEMWKDRLHADTRIARRAATISRLSQMISEREVDPGMRRTLLLQAKRLAWLAERRIEEIGIEIPTEDEYATEEET
jgi:hypothetical protein